MQNNLECVFINLDSAPERRAGLETNFAACKGPGWGLTRFAAVEPRAIQDIPGRLRPSEKACFESHRRAIGSMLGSRQPVFMLEDDALLGRHTAELIDKIVFANDDLRWDLLYTDICVPHIGPMLELLRVRQQLASPADVRLIDLRTFAFAGATAYILNPRSIGKLHAILASYRTLEEPFDLCLHNLVRQGRLSAFALFPFATSLSESSETSQVQEPGAPGPDRIWNLFRKMIWVDRDIAAHRGALDEIDRLMGDEETRSFGTLFAAMASKDFTPK
jgi:GR25 family glycosyltransferase involved in LPS biosynthesis